ncbi:hypothetical protein TSUD_135500 [Trifolium subterraneum]|uniref:Uncharacterized protein n=1 Tax=Trifolium subterraneum TaxID=3900 RepID=A0A2Z6P788_TRISU|nr:hypothetical protein TSUD_135500 [Trifolium subterraneum]
MGSMGRVVWGREKKVCGREMVEDFRRKAVGRTREEEGEGEGIQVGRVKVNTKAGKRKQGEGVDGQDGVVAQKDGGLGVTKDH